MTGAFINPLLFGGGVLEGFGRWFVGEFVNFIAVVPCILTIHDRMWFAERRKLAKSESGASAWLPVAALLASVVVALLVGGPGSLAFPVPALLWCAVSYGLFVTSLLTLAFSAWTLLGLSSGVLAITLDAKSGVESVRLGVMLVSLAPLMVASIIGARNRLIEQLRYNAAHDGLTGLSNRSAFFELASERLANRGEAAVLMLDIDHFKVINDSHGHLSGDRVLQNFADCLLRCIRSSDVAGRMGGEEFAVLLPECGRDEAERVAERIRRSFAAIRIVDGGKQIRGTVSIGFTVRRGNEDIAALLAVADRALYRAKENGRNRSEFLAAATAENPAAVAAT
ncbi:MAG TPA: diguanylate cyclase [Xanthobacteraceae bacterium]|nr:diguanylate cyclase [Xanthobacteraceae bacterium]